jgi:hypothetical protein
MNVLDWLAQTQLATWVTQSAGWALALTIHAFGSATMVGFFFIIGLRLLGLFETIPYASLQRLIPFVWVSLVFQALSGFLLWLTKPAQYLADTMFDVKITLVVAASIVTWFFQGILRQQAAEWQAAGTVTSRGVKFGAATSVLWASVLIGGRLTAYLGSLYPS